MIQCDGIAHSGIKLWRDGWTEYIYTQRPKCVRNW
jgi:hypothetical protein